MAIRTAWDAWFPTRLASEREVLATWKPYPLIPGRGAYFLHAVDRWRRGGFMNGKTRRRDDALLLHYETQALEFVKRNLQNPVRVTMEDEFWNAAKWMCYIAERGLTPREAAAAILACDSIMVVDMARDGRVNIGVRMRLPQVDAMQRGREEKTAMLDIHSPGLVKRCGEPELLFLEYARLMARAAEVNRGLDGEKGGIRFVCVERLRGAQPGKGEVTARRLATVRALPPARLTEASPFFLTADGVRMTVPTYLTGATRVPAMHMFHNDDITRVLPLGDTRGSASNLHEEIRDTATFREAATYNLAVLNTLDAFTAPEELKVQLAALPGDMVEHLLSFVNVLNGWPTPTRASVLGTQ